MSTALEAMKSKKKGRMAARLSEKDRLYSRFDPFVFVMRRYL